MQLSQGRIARWDKEQLTRTDRAILRVRQIMKDLHKAEIEERLKNGLPALEHRVRHREYDIVRDRPVAAQ